MFAPLEQKDIKLNIEEYFKEYQDSLREILYNIERQLHSINFQFSVHD